MERRGIFLSMLFLALTAATAGVECFDAMRHYPAGTYSADLFYALENTWKVLLAAALVFGVSRFAYRLAVYLLGVCFIWVTCNCWLLATLEIVQYSGQPLAVVRCLWGIGLAPFVVTACLGLWRHRGGWRLAGTGRLIEPQGLNHLSIRDVMGIFCRAGLLFATVRLIRSELDRTTITALLVDDVLRSIRLAAVAPLCLSAVLGSRPDWIRAAMVFPTALAMGMAISYAFDAPGQFAGWTRQSLMESVLLMGSFWMVRAAGYRLVRVPADTPRAEEAPPI